MARRAKARDIQATAEQVSGFFERIEARKGELLVLKMDYLRACKPVHEAVRNMISEGVNELGMNRKAVTVKLKQRDYRRKADALEDDLDADVAAYLEAISEKLGDLADTPLGRSARDRAAAEGREALESIAR